MELSAINREKVIVRTSITGILTNVFLANFKIAVGRIANSIAVVLDGVNNYTDALSSVITIIGTKLAGRAPDRKHPLGHGRIEYLSSMIVSAIVLSAGITSLIESVRKIIHPEVRVGAGFRSHLPPVPPFPGSLRRRADLPVHPESRYRDDPGNAQ